MKTPRPATLLRESPCFESRNKSKGYCVILDESRSQLSTVPTTSPPPRPPLSAGRSGEAPQILLHLAEHQGGGKPTLMTISPFELSPSLHPWFKPFAHKATWKLMFLLISLFESTIMKSGCTVVNSTFYIYSSYLSYIYKL